MRSRFLSARQGKKELSDYVQELKTLIAALQLDPLPEMDLITIFMESLHTGVAQTEVFQVHPTFFEAAVYIALKAEFNFKAARFGTHGYNPNLASSFNSFNRPEPMNLNLAETDEEAELRAVEQHRNIRRCFTCGRTKHLRPNSPSSRARMATSDRTPAANQKSVTVRENVDSQ